MRLEPRQELGRLFEAALTDAQVTEADERGLAPRRHAPLEMTAGREKLRFRLVPTAGGSQDPSVVGTAERGDDVPPVHEVRRPRASTDRHGERR